MSKNCSICSILRDRLVPIEGKDYATSPTEIINHLVGEQSILTFKTEEPLYLCKTHKIDTLFVKIYDPTEDGDTTSILGIDELFKVIPSGREGGIRTRKLPFLKTQKKRRLTPYLLEV